MFEKTDHPLVPQHVFIKRLAWNFTLGLFMSAIALFIGMWGYHYFEGLAWDDAYVNAAMILSGMGPLDKPTTFYGKLFAGSYALFSGLFFLLIMGVIFLPVIHRLLHRFHLQEEKKS